MGWWRMNADTLAGSRFVTSPLAETTACLIALEKGTAAHPGERRWRDAHLPAYRERLAGDPLTARIVRAAFGRNWIADFLTPTPAGEGEAPFHDELARIRATPAEAARADLAVSSGRPLPSALAGCDPAPRVADLLEWIWTEAVRPYWARRRQIFEADIVARTRQLSQGGWAAALDTLRPGMRWLGEGRLQVNVHDFPPRTITGARLLFVPVTQRQGWVSWEIPASPAEAGASAGSPPAPCRYAVVYPCSGVLAEADRPAAPEALGRLLGPARARVLTLLGTPMSTTQLVALTGQGLGSVGRHLRVLLDARLVQRRRAGRSVLYYRTAAGDTLVAAQGGEDAASGHGAG